MYSFKEFLASEQFEQFLSKTDVNDMPHIIDFTGDTESMTVAIQTLYNDYFKRSVNLSLQMLEAYHDWLHAE